MHNLGSIFRTADCFGIEKMFLCGITAQPPHREIHKTALGAENTVPWEYSADTLSLCKSLKEKGVKLIGIEQTDNSRVLDKFEFNPHEASALILGNEVHGIQQEVLDLCDECLEIPQFGTKHSFNVSVCTGIVLWHLLAQKES